MRYVDVQSYLRRRLQSLSTIPVQTSVRQGHGNDGESRVCSRMHGTCTETAAFGFFEFFTRSLRGPRRANSTGCRTRAAYSSVS